MPPHADKSLLCTSLDMSMTMYIADTELQCDQVNQSGQVNYYCHSYKDYDGLDLELQTL